MKKKALTGNKFTFSYIWCYLKSECYRSSVLKQKAVGTCVLEFGLGPEQNALSLTLKMLDLSLVGNYRVS